jgi:hypothetical protein
VLLDPAAQCGNAAYGVCQNMASDRNKSPCGWAFDRGMYNCDKERFWAFYGRELILLHQVTATCCGLLWAQRSLKGIASSRRQQAFYGTLKCDVGTLIKVFAGS